MKHKELISKLTLNEKISLVSGYGSWHTYPVERLGIKSMMMTDGPVGLRKVDEGKTRAHTSVCFPSGCLTACSFDRDLLYRMGDAIGKECQAYDVGMILGPAINIKRSPLCGRNFEYLSEDPYLSGELSAAYINGVQSNNVGTSLKHYTANNQEYRRMSYDAIVSERAMREIYLRGFEIAVKKSQPYTIMCSYNKVNGEHTSQSKKYLTDILRDEWGFEGAVISDWGAVYELDEAIKAGLDLEMPGNNNANAGFIKVALSDGTMSMADLDRAVDRIITLSEKYIHTDREFDFEQDHRLSRRIARQSIVLLKNDGALLPLSKGEKLCVIGGFAVSPRYQGGGSSHIESYRVDSPLDEIKKFADVVYAKGFDAFDDTEDARLLAEAVEKAKAVGKAVVFAGLPENYESEGFDRSHMQLPACQNKLISMLCDAGVKTVVVLQNGAAVELPWADRADAIVEAYLCGEAAGVAIASVLSGRVNPSGKLAESFPVKLSDNPSYLNFPGDGKNVFYAEDVYVGYRYYDKKEMAVTFPFGHGLSYTTFEYSNLRLSADSLTDKDTLTVTADITNTGAVDGAEVVQLYVGAGYPDGAHVERPLKELKGFDKVFLKAGETKTVSFTLTGEDFAYYEERINGWFAPSAQYTVMVAASSRDVRLSQAVNLTATKKIPLHITGDTTFGELLRDERTQQYTMDNLISQEASGILSFSPDAIAALQDHNPLRGLRNFSNKTTQEVNEIITEIKDLTDWE